VGITRNRHVGITRNRLLIPVLILVILLIPGTTQAYTHTEEAIQGYPFHYRI
jgi:hypothetical protein